MASGGVSAPRAIMGHLHNSLPSPTGLETCHVAIVVITGLLCVNGPRPTPAILHLSTLSIAGIVPKRSVRELIETPPQSNPKPPPDLHCRAKRRKFL